MSENTNPSKIYFEKRKAVAEQSARQLKRENALLSTGRLLTFLLSAIVLIYWVNLRMSDSWPLWLALPALAGFAALVVRQQQVRKKLAYQQSLAWLNETELARLELELAGIDHAEEARDDKHPYANDLDLFAAHGLFPLLNRTATHEGRALLIARLKGQYPRDIAAEQAAIRELAQKPDHLQDFQALGAVHQPEADSRAAIHQLAQEAPDAVSALVRLLAWMMPVAFLTCWAAWGAGMVSGYWLLGIYLTNLALLGGFSQSVLKHLTEQSKLKAAFALYRSLIRTTLAQQWQSPHLQSLTQHLRGDHDVLRALGQLEQLLSYLEMRLNVFWSITVNTIFLLDIHLLLAMNRWLGRYRADLPQWMDGLAELDVLHSIAGYAHSQPAFVFPTIAQVPYQFEAREVGHPLILARKRVCNDFSIGGHQIHLVTGANMSGKSTFLRTLGTNAVLAMIGAPVCAAEMTISHTQLFTSMRISDDLGENVSSFYAELLRLRQLLDLLEQQEQPVFLLLDEVLRGTNSRDRHLGVRGILSKLLALPAYGLVTTHDLALGDLETQSQGRITNHSFNSQIRDEQLHFDYRYTQGQCHSFSASQLMQSLGLIEAEDSPKS